MSWDTRFLSLARHIASWSKDPSTQVGAVITDKMNRILSVGFNGFPRGVADDDLRLRNREMKYEMVLHAEANAILFAKHIPWGSSVYIWPLAPCARCAGMIIQTGISRVVAPPPIERWADSNRLARVMFEEARVKFEELTIPGV